MSNGSSKIGCNPSGSQVSFSSVKEVRSSAAFKHRQVCSLIGGSIAAVAPFIASFAFMVLGITVASIAIAVIAIMGLVVGTIVYTYAETKNEKAIMKAKVNELLKETPSVNMKSLGHFSIEDQYIIVKALNSPEESATEYAESLLHYYNSWATAYEEGVPREDHEVRPSDSKMVGGLGGIFIGLSLCFGR